MREQECLGLAIEAAKRSGAFIRKNLGRVTKTSYKGAINLVTNVDRGSEEIILSHIRRRFPGHSILSEECGLVDNGSSYTWIIDPLDGTSNFFREFPFFCVSIALEKERTPIIGVVYDPMRDELFYAEKGKGAFRDGTRIAVSRVNRLSKAFLATGFAYGIHRAKNTNIGNFGRFLKRAFAVRRAGSAALDLCYVACGTFDGFWELGLHPWDCAAGALLVTEAGGMVTRCNGSHFSHFDKEILATNGIVHRQMIRVFSR